MKRRNNLQDCPDTFAIFVPVMGTKYFLEACCPTIEAVRAAAGAGARRIELCERLDVGGVTPSRALVRQALAESPLPVNVLIRPREGDFVYSPAEAAAMLESIRQCGTLVVGREAVQRRVNGVVVGALRADGSVDEALMRRLVAQARASGLEVTFHRAFDETADPFEALEAVIGLGCDRLLTSGHAPDAFAGRATLARLVSQAAGRIVIMAGCGVRPSNIEAIASVSSAPEYHSSCLLQTYP